jgi:hypothetical protein
MPDVEFIWKKGNVDLPGLEKPIDAQVTAYENAIN